MKRPILKSSNPIWWFLTLLYAGTFLTILILAYNGKLPVFLTQNDKLAHLILYCIATYLGHRVINCRQMKLLGYAVPLFPILFAIFTITEEAMQSLSPNRSLDAMDLIASLLGVVLGYWLAARGTGGIENRK
ncbi:MAG: VanZ family protein [Leptolyngbyaceae cyanobacterium RU_5_1]|nr:VanZ family protein [Leptolyngbyaceae cyanobacterium RU_5_1]